MKYLFWAFCAMWAVYSIARATGSISGDWLEAGLLALAFGALAESRGQIEKLKLRAKP